jgi:hypothetical protein
MTRMSPWTSQNSTASCRVMIDFFEGPWWMKDQRSKVLYYSLYRVRFTSEEDQWDFFRSRASSWIKQPQQLQNIWCDLFTAPFVVQIHKYSLLLPSYWHVPYLLKKCRRPLKAPNTLSSRSLGEIKGWLNAKWYFERTEQHWKHIYIFVAHFRNDSSLFYYSKSSTKSTFSHQVAQLSEPYPTVLTTVQTLWFFAKIQHFESTYREKWGQLQKSKLSSARKQKINILRRSALASSSTRDESWAL